MPLRNQKPHTGHTLIELLLVVVLLAIIAGAVAVYLDAPLRKSRVMNAAERWLAIDQIVRSATIDRSAILAVRRTNSGSEVSASWETGGALGKWSFDPRIDVKLFARGMGKSPQDLQPTEILRFDAGRGSRDYVVQIREKQSRKDLSIAGGTGVAKSSQGHYPR